MNDAVLANIKASITTIPDYPKAGIMFRDITSLIQNNQAFNQTIDCLVAQFQDQGYTKVLGAEARGFIFGAALAHRLNIGFIPARKPNKLPRETVSQEYQLEYGTDALHIHKDAVSSNDNVLVVDDLIATGGTIIAAINLVRQLGATVTDAAFVVALPDLGGEDKLTALNVKPFSLISFEGE
ncbi:adenine phosphoribosyltransferase [Saccharobesus litoralis]|uniref:Adenine phosphoribosyltransferase n=1 Tax=Saccharobesus litoralis TaxID=2172099 RepID=A0A2S0VM78_9ALTE|nr:adenine phosphoribosyltransferase [Saccharobesus litoralis]AWB65327.1 adenine phosphoribosyltransferase [Saccharobesus litoralis]